MASQFAEMLSVPNDGRYHALDLRGKAGANFAEIVKRGKADDACQFTTNA